jgi:hypothetical protein
LPISHAFDRLAAQPDRGIHAGRTQVHKALRHRQIRIARELLDGPCGRSTHREERAERMPKHVNALPNVRPLGGQSHPVLRDLPRERHPIRLTEHAPTPQMAMISGPNAPAIVTIVLASGTSPASMRANAR